MSDYILQLKNVKKSFGGVKALKGVDLAIKKGEIHCLAGENGCGKSTLIKIISGVYTADEGEIQMNDMPYTKLTPVQAIEQGIQVIYQDFSIFPNLTVAENLALNKELMNKRKWVNYKRFRSIAKEAISKIDFKVDLDERVENLSVADKQLIAISRALLNDAKLIIMDEPTTALTKKEVKALFEIIKHLQSQGIAILFVSHKLEEIFEICESFTILRSGENVATGLTSELDYKKFAYYMTGRAFEEGIYTPTHEIKESIMKVRGLKLQEVYEDICFEVRKGEILGITGLLGSGRTELVQSIFGIKPADSGEIWIDNKITSIRSVKDAMNCGIGYVPEDRLTEGLFLQQSIADNMVISNLEKLSQNLGILKEEEIDEEVKGWIEKLAIMTSDGLKPVQTLSGGNQQKVVLARWLSRELKILILNGPTVGVDIGSKYDIHKLLKHLAKNGLAVVIISDDIKEILENCNRILIMRNGHIIGETTPSETSESKLTQIIAMDA